MRRSAAFFLALVATLALLVMGGSPAFAHATLLRSDPAEGAVVAAPPAKFSLTYNEPVSPTVLKLFAPDGTAAALSRYRLEDATLLIDAPSDLRHGTYALSWRVISADGHPVGGTVTFSIGAPGGATEGATEGIDPSLAAATWVARVAIYVALFFGAGGAAFGGLVAPLPARAVPVLRAALVIGIVMLPVAIALQGLDALGLSLTSVARSSVFAEGAATTYGRTAAIALTALVLALATLALGTGRRRAVAGLATLALVGLALAASGHASDAPPQAITRPAVFLHTASVAFWIGALLPLAMLMREGGSAADAALARFSRAIPFAILPLVAAGGFLAIVQIAEPSALWTTAYGRVLLAKLALLVLLFAAAAFNRFRLTRLALAGDGGAERRIARAIRAEIVLALLILATVALWRFTPPPRSLLAAAAEPATTHIHTETAMADITVAPGRTGAVTASVYLQTGDFAPLAAREVTFEFANPTAGVEPIRAKARRAADGTWRTDSLTLPLAGTWTVDVAVLVSDFDLVRLDGEITIRR